MAIQRRRLPDRRRLESGGGGGGVRWSATTPVRSGRRRRRRRPRHHFLLLTQLLATGGGPICPYMEWNQRNIILVHAFVVPPPFPVGIHGCRSMDLIFSANKQVAVPIRRPRSQQHQQQQHPARNKDDDDDDGDQDGNSTDATPTAHTTQIIDLLLPAEALMNNGVPTTTTTSASSTDPPNQSRPPSRITSTASSSTTTTTTTTTTTASAAINNTSTTTTTTTTGRTRRKPAFPKEAMSNLIKDEQKLDHRFISFIDYSITRTYTQSVRLVEPRTYARPEPFRAENRDCLPRIEDVAEPPSRYGPVALFFAWNGIPARIVIAGTAYSIFPFIVSFFNQFSVDLNALKSLVSDFLPGLAIVLGTYFSVTITILYDRFANLQEVVNQEASILALTCRSVMDSFEHDPETRIDATQAVADQVRTMIFDSRGKETLGVIYNDPYARLLSLVLQNNNKGTVDKDLRSSIETLMTLRSRRMTFENMALAPTHFDVMTFLCGMLLVGFSLGTVAAAQTNGVPTQLARTLFASLVVCYTLFYEMSFDLNRPFSGIYQIRRSGAAMHFLQIKHWIASDPVLAGAVDFEEVMDDRASAATPPPDCDGDCEKQKAKTWYN